jgi:HemY protein
MPVWHASGGCASLPDMRVLLWVVGLFALAVGTTVAARYNAGYVLLVLPTHRVELSVNLAAILLFAAVLVFYVILRTLVLALGMPVRAREYRRSQEQARGRRTLQDALKAFFEGRYGRAERAAEEAVAAGESPALALTVAARAAHELRAFQARDEYLQQMEKLVPQEGYLRAMTRAELLLEEQRYHDALHALSQLPDRHTAALKLEMRAHQLARSWDQVLALLPQLDKRKVFEPGVLAQLRHYAQTENLKRKAEDGRALRDYWERLATADRKDSRVAAAGAQSFIALGECAEAHRIIEESLEESWDSTLLPLYVECLPRDARKHLERAEAWLKRYPGDPILLLALGLICMKQELWGKARSYLEASLSVEPSHTAFVKLGELLERIGKPEEASGVYRRGLDLALVQLKECTGGRRKAAL